MPIGGVSGGQYTANFDGNADTDASGDGGPYTISNLFINSTVGGRHWGLFGSFDSNGNHTVEDVGLVNVDITVSTTTSSDNVFVGGLAGYTGPSTIEDSYTTGRVRAGESATNPVTFTYSGQTYVGGLAGRSFGSITSSYSLADVTGYSTGTQGSISTYAGGLAGYAGGNVSASYAGGDVVANTSAQDYGYAYAGGLVGYLTSSGEVNASYARGDVSASYDDIAGSVNGTSYVGGLVGYLSANITASFSTGAVTASGDGTLSTGGLVGFRTGGGSTTYSYWDTQTSGVSTSATGTPMTTSQLQTPTAYGTGNSIYADWDLDLDGVTGGDVPWQFGTAYRYPALKYGTLNPADQRATTTLSVSAATIWERALSTPSRVNSATVTATLNRAWNTDVTVTLATSTAYTLGTTTVTIPAGAISATTSLTATNNFVDAADNVVTIARANDHTSDAWVIVGATATTTIKDDDSLAKPTGVKLSVDGTNMQVDWTQVTGATGYKVQWNTANSWAGSITGSSTIASGGTVSHKITSGLTANTPYYVRVTATGAAGVDDSAPSDVVSATTKTNAGDGDYDADNDGLIEITTLAQLNAMRYDLDGDGVVDDLTDGTATSIYAAAFPNAEDNMGCNESAVTIQSGTGNAPCVGYELRANLDFNTNNSMATSGNPTGADSGDTYWNGGAGWTPIGISASAPFTAEFDGNNDSDSSGDGGPFTISNLHVNLSSTSGTSYAGLFGILGAGANVSNVALAGVSVTGSTGGDGVYVGALAGHNQGTITESWSLGAVTANKTSATNEAGKKSYAGGLVGRNEGTIRSAYSRAGVTATAHSGNEAHAGGLVGLNGTSTAATIAASYATGDVTANRGSETAGNPLNSVRTGGLVSVNHGTITASYATGDGAADGRNTDTGGLVAINASGATINASYSLGSQTATTTGGTANTGGFAGTNSGTVNYSYWDTQTSGTATGVGSGSATGVTGKTTTQLQTPTTETGIYANWDVDVDGTTGNDDPWDFGTNAQYPVLDFGSQVVSKQRATLTITASHTTIWERADTGLGRVNVSTITATLSGAWEDDVAVTLPSGADHTLSASTITIAAGSTSGTATLTAVDDTTNQTSPDSRSVSLAATAVDSYVVAVSASVTITISDDDNVAKVTGVSAARIADSTTSARDKLERGLRRGRLQGAVEERRRGLGTRRARTT